MVKLNGPFGAGSQLASLSAPGLSFWKYKSSDPSAAYLKGIQLPNRKSIEWICDLKAIGVIQRDRPEGFRGRHVSLAEVERVGFIQRLAGLVGKVDRINGAFGKICSKAELRDYGALQIIVA
jgi:hypothetical protein